MSGVVIRCENAAEEPAVRVIHETAFGRPDEADLVDSLRKEGAVLVSLIADVNSRVVGHILFSRMWIDGPDVSLAAVALAPVAVLPIHQGKGIGGALIRSGLDSLRDRGEGVAIVLGHPAYYARFGFSTAKAHGLRSPFPPESYMAAELSAGALDGVSGKVRYPAAFGL